MIQRVIDAYKLARREGRAMLRRFPAADRTLGYLLRRVETTTGLGKLLARDEALARGVVEARGLTIHHPVNDPGVVGSLVQYGDYEPETREAIERLLRRGDCFVDLGAHVGFFSLIAGRRVGSTGRVFAFEPVAATADFLRRNVQENGLADIVEPVNLAVSSRPETMSFELHPSSSVSHKVATKDSDTATLAIEATSLDAFFEAYAWPPVRLVKMDVEGAELDALEGMRQLCRRNPDLAVIFELHVANLERVEVDAFALFDVLRSMGFSRFTRLLEPLEIIEGRSGVEKALAVAKRVNFNVLAEQPR